MRFETLAAYVIGILLPLLETCRRGFGHWTVGTMTMLEDYAAGGLLLFAAILSSRRVHTASRWMLGAWSAVGAMMATSLFYHVEETIRGEAAEPFNAVVLAIKAMLLATCLIALVGSFRRAAAPP